MKTRLFFAAIITSMMLFASCTKESAIEPTKNNSKSKFPKTYESTKEVEKSSLPIVEEP